MIRIYGKIALVGVFLCALLFSGVYSYYYTQWKHLWTLESPLPFYEIKTPKDSVIRVVMIGDSWAAIHHDNGMDTFLRLQIERLTGRSAVVKSKGKRGEKTKGIYRLMFETSGDGTKPLLSEGADYCLIITGINDSGANLGTRQYCHYYHQILNFLLFNNIRPIIIEIPNIDKWHIYKDKPLKDILSDYIKSITSGGGMYRYKKYREELYSMLMDQQLLEKVIYLRMDEWNTCSPEIDESIFLDDLVHLNGEGYKKLDYSIATAIMKDL